MLTTTLTTFAALCVSAFAVQTANVVLEKASGNTTVAIEINGLFNDASKLAGTSMLFITGSEEVPLNTVTCTSFGKAEDSRQIAQSFTSENPASLSKDDVLASIVCTSSYIANAPPIPGGMTPSSSAAGSSPTKTQPKKSGQTEASAASATPQHTGNAASNLYTSSEFFAGLAVAGFAVAFAI